MEKQYDIVENLVVQAGARFSIENPDEYIESNIIGFYSILKGCRHHPVGLVYASSIPVDGGNKKDFFSFGDCVSPPSRYTLPE